MKVVILAAGKGSRLGSPGPKPLTLLSNGQSILGYQLEQILKHATVDDIVVVVGFQKEKIMEEFPDLTYVYNARYATTNTAKSLLAALKKCTGDVLWLNGDVVMLPEVLKKAFANPRTSMVVNVGDVGEEEVKYRQNDDGRILEVSKSVKNPQGEALGVNFCAANDLSKLIEGLKQCSDRDYFERAIEYCIQDGMAVWSIPVDRLACTEVDFPEDLKRANEMLQRSHLI